MDYIEKVHSKRKDGGVYKKENVRGKVTDSNIRSIIGLYFYSLVETNKVVGVEEDDGVN